MLSCRKKVFSIVLMSVLALCAHSSCYAQQQQASMRCENELQGGTLADGSWSQCSFANSAPYYSGSFLVAKDVQATLGSPITKTACNNCSGTKTCPGKWVRLGPDSEPLVRELTITMSGGATAGVSFSGSLSGGGVSVYPSVTNQTTGSVAGAWKYPHRDQAGRSVKSPATSPGYRSGYGFSYTTCSANYTAAARLCRNGDTEWTKTSTDYTGTFGASFKLWDVEYLNEFCAPR